MNLRVLSLAALLAAVPTAAFAKKEVPMPLAPQLPVVVTFDQRELSVDVMSYNGMPYNPSLPPVGNVAAALIVAAIVAKQEHDAAVRGPAIKEILGPYDFETKMTEKLRASLASEGISTSPQLQFRSTVADPASPDGNREQPLLPDEGVVMYIRPHYAMAHTAQKIAVRLTVSVDRRTKKESGRIAEKNLFLRTYEFEVLLDRSFGRDPDKNLDRWRGVGGEALRKDLDFAIGQAVDMLVYDLSATGRTEADDGVGLREYAEYDDSRMMARTLRNADGVMWIRPRGSLYLKGGLNAEPDGPKPVAASAPAMAPAAAAAGAPSPSPAGAN